MTPFIGRRLFGLGLGATLCTMPFAGARAEDAASEAVAALPVVPDMELGNPDAKVTVVEYASFTCPHCARFHTDVFKPLLRDYIEPGKIRFIYREVYFDRYALWAAMVARCGGEIRYFGISEMIYAAQSQWTASNDPAVIVENLRRIGRTAGLEDAQLDACLQDGDMAQAMVAKFQTDSTADGIDSTPSLVINGKKHANMGYQALAKIIDDLLAE